MAGRKPRQPLKAWQQPIVFRPSERDLRMLKALAEWLDEDIQARVIRRAIERLYELEKRKAERSA